MTKPRTHARLRAAETQAPKTARKQPVRPPRSPPRRPGQIAWGTSIHPSSAWQCDEGSLEGTRRAVGGFKLLAPLGSRLSNLGGLPAAWVVGWWVGDDCCLDSPPFPTAAAERLTPADFLKKRANTRSHFHVISSHATTVTQEH